MDDKERALLKGIFKINSFVISNLSEKNVSEIRSLYKEFEQNLMTLIQESKPKVILIWKNFPTMTEEEIRRELNNIEKYPDLNSLKSAVKGYLDLRKVSKIKTRETLIKHIIETYKRGRFISRIGKE